MFKRLLLLILKAKQKQGVHATGGYWEASYLLQHEWQRPWRLRRWRMDAGHEDRRQ